MLLLGPLRFSCETCVRGHRPGLCKHPTRKLIEVRPKGRPKLATEPSDLPPQKVYFNEILVEIKFHSNWSAKKFKTLHFQGHQFKIELNDQCHYPRNKFFKNDKIGNFKTIICSKIKKKKKIDVNSKKSDSKFTSKKKYKKIFNNNNINSSQSLSSPILYPFNSSLSSMTLNPTKLSYMTSTTSSLNNKDNYFLGKEDDYSLFKKQNNNNNNKKNEIINNITKSMVHHDNNNSSEKNKNRKCKKSSTKTMKKSVAADRDRKKCLKNERKKRKELHNSENYSSDAVMMKVKLPIPKKAQKFGIKNSNNQMQENDDSNSVNDIKIKGSSNAEDFFFENSSGSSKSNKQMMMFSTDVACSTKTKNPIIIQKNNSKNEILEFDLNYDPAETYSTNNNNNYSTAERSCGEKYWELALSDKKINNNHGILPKHGFKDEKIRYSVQKYQNICFCGDENCLIPHYNNDNSSPIYYYNTKRIECNNNNDESSISEEIDDQCVNCEQQQQPQQKILSLSNCYNNNKNLFGGIKSFNSGNNKNDDEWPQGPIPPDAKEENKFHVESNGFRKKANKVFLQSYWSANKFPPKEEPTKQPQPPLNYMMCLTDKTTEPKIEATQINEYLPQIHGCSNCFCLQESNDFELHNTFLPQDFYTTNLYPNECIAKRSPLVASSYSSPKQEFLKCSKNDFFNSNSSSYNLIGDPENIWPETPETMIQPMSWMYQNQNEDNLMGLLDDHHYTSSNSFPLNSANGNIFKLSGYVANQAEISNRF